MTASIQQTLIVVTPVYEDSEASRRLFQELAPLFGNDLFVVAVDDGSVHHPLDPIHLGDAGLDGVVIRLRRNVGHQRAISVGLAYVAERQREGQRIVVMDSDGEDLAASIQTLLAALEADTVDVAVASRRKREESLWFRVFYAVYKRIFGLLSGREIGFGNFLALKANALRRLVSMQESSIHLAAAVLASKLRIKTCPLDRGRRYCGRSKMNFVGLALHGFRALMVFAEDVLVRVGIACTITAGLSVVAAMAAVILKLLGYSTPGWFSVALGLLVLIFLQTGALAMMSLMLTGVVRNGTVASTMDYLDFIDQVLPARKHAPHAG